MTTSRDAGPRPPLTLVLSSVLTAAVQGADRPALLAAMAPEEEPVSLESTRAARRAAARANHPSVVGRRLAAAAEDEAPLAAVIPFQRRSAEQHAPTPA